MGIGERAISHRQLEYIVTKKHLKIQVLFVIPDASKSGNDIVCCTRCSGYKVYAPSNGNPVLGSELLEMFAELLEVAVFPVAMKLLFGTALIDVRTVKAADDVFERDLGNRVLLDPLLEPVFVAGIVGEDENELVARQFGGSRQTDCVGRVEYPGHEFGSIFARLGSQGIAQQVGDSVSHQTSP